jgi:L-lactate utilization protein LutC
MNYDALASSEALARTKDALTQRGFTTESVATRAEALARLQALIPEGASIMNGASRTLEQIGFIELLKEGDAPWNNLHAPIVAEEDPEKKLSLRHQALFADYYLGSAHAIAETGEILVASRSGSQLPHLAFTSKNIILVVSTKKIMPDFATAMARVREHVLPQEDARMKSVGLGGSGISKLLTLYDEPSFSGRAFHILFVEEALGF